MIKVEQSVIINRPAEQVWKYMSNVEENTPKWDRGVLMARVTSDGRLGAGSTIELRRQLLGRTRASKIQVFAWQPPHMVTFQVKVGQVVANQSYIFEPIENGTKLRAVADLDWIGSWKWIAPNKESKMIQSKEIFRSIGASTLEDRRSFVLSVFNRVLRV